MNRRSLLGGIVASVCGLLWPSWAKANQSEAATRVRAVYWSGEGHAGKHHGLIMLSACGTIATISAIKTGIDAHSSGRQSPQLEWSDGFQRDGLSEVLIYPTRDSDDDATAVMFAIINKVSSSVKMEPPAEYTPWGSYPLFISEPERPKSGPCTHWRRPGTICCAWCGSTEWFTKDLKGTVQ